MPLARMTSFSTTSRPSFSRTAVPVRPSSRQVAVEARRGLERGEVAARARLAEALAPDLVAREHGRDEAAALRLAAVVDECGTEEPDAEDVEDGWGVGARQLGLHDRLLELRAATAA